MRSIADDRAGVPGVSGAWKALDRFLVAATAPDAYSAADVAGVAAAPPSAAWRSFCRRS